MRRHHATGQPHEERVGRECLETEDAKKPVRVDALLDDRPPPRPPSVLDAGRQLAILLADYAAAAATGNIDSHDDQPL